MLLCLEHEFVFVFSSFQKSFGFESSLYLPFCFPSPSSLRVKANYKSKEATEKCLMRDVVTEIRLKEVRQVYLECVVGVDTKFGNS